MGTPDPEARPYGRRAFLAIVAGGLGAIALGGPLQRLTSALNPLDAAAGGRWRIYNVSNPMPTFDPATWRLRVDGLVERPLELDYAALLALPSVEHVADFRCVTGWTVENVRWRGVALADVLAQARPLPHARGVSFHSAEQPYLDSLSREQAALPHVLLAHHLDGLALTRPHGAPVRLVIPQMYGYKGVKWLERIELAERPAVGYWEQRGWPRDAWIDEPV